MRICMLLWKEYPTDIRIAKEARALQAAGHEVRLLCRAEPDRPNRETVDGVDVVRVPHDPNALSRWPKTLTHLLRNVQPRWADALASAVTDWGADALHVHDLPMVHTGLAVGDEHDVPVVADLHENYPEAIRQWRRMDTPADVLTSPSKLAEYTLQPVRRWKRIERTAVRRADRVLTVAPEAREHYLQDCGADPASVRIVDNTVDREAYDQRDYREQDGVPDPVADAGLNPDGEFLLTYTGKFAPHRGMESVVRALPQVLAEEPDARLVMVGAPGTDRYGEQFRETIEELGVMDRVTFTGWVDFEAVPAFVAASDVCLVPHAATPHTETTIPHKLFQYMAMSKPVLVSDVPPLERVVEDAEAGAVVPAGDADATAAALAEMADDRERTRELGHNGQQAVDEEYNWQRDAERLRETYDGLS